MHNRSSPVTSVVIWTAHFHIFVNVCTDTFLSLNCFTSIIAIVIHCHIICLSLIVALFCLCRLL